MTTKTKLVQLADLKTNLFVRKEIDQDRVLYFAELIENGQTLPPIKITRDNRVVDGRHRIEAHVLNDLKGIRVEVVDIDDEIELIAEAYKANVGGALPPTPQDTEHTVMLLLERGESKKRIGELLGFPPGMARRYVNDTQSKMSRAKLLRAAGAVTDGGLTVAKAAEQYEVDIEKLKETLSGHRKKHKRGIVEIQRGLTTTYKSNGLKNAALIRSLLEKYEDGDVTERQVREIFEHIDSLQKRAIRSFGDWKKRFDALNSNGAGKVV